MSSLVFTVIPPPFSPEQRSSERTNTTASLFVSVSELNELGNSEDWLKIFSEDVELTWQNRTLG